MLVIHPGECIDCGVCEPECPAEAIVCGDLAEHHETRNPPADADDFNGVANKFETDFSAQPATDPSS
jgi:ferredoxin